MKKQPTAAKNSDFVVNPKTGRLVKINSRAYNQLLKDKILDLHTDRQKNILFDGAHAAEVKGKTMRNAGDKILQHRRKLQAGVRTRWLHPASQSYHQREGWSIFCRHKWHRGSLARNLLAQHLVLWRVLIFFSFLLAYSVSCVSTFSTLVCVSASFFFKPNVAYLQGRLIGNGRNVFSTHTFSTHI